MKDQFIELTNDDLAQVSGGFLGALLGLAGPVMNLVGGLIGKKKGGGDKGEKQDDGVAAATAERDQALAQLKNAQGASPTGNMMGEGAVQQRPATA
jgi:bacteriocin-like protein